MKKRKGWLAMDYYKVLGVAQEADEEQIKQAYRKLAKKYHPDLHPDDAASEAKFKDIVEAYEILGDAAKRKEYDEKRKRSGEPIRKTKEEYSSAPGMDMGKFTKDMERYFGFSFQGKQPGTRDGDAKKSKKNPLDVTEMFEAFMKVK